MMSEPCQLYVTNTETNKCTLYYVHDIYSLFRKEGLDAEPLNEYFDEVNGTTKEERMKAEKRYKEWEKTLEERDLMNLEDKKLNEIKHLK